MGYDKLSRVSPLAAVPVNTIGIGRLVKRIAVWLANNSESGVHVALLGSSTDSALSLQAIGRFSLALTVWRKPAGRCPSRLRKCALDASALRRVSDPTRPETRQQSAVDAWRPNLRSALHASSGCSRQIASPRHVPQGSMA